MLTRQEAIKIAKKTVIEEGWSWKEPIKVYRNRKYIFGTSYWHIITNIHYRGANVVIKIDDKTGEVIFKKLVSR